MAITRVDWNVFSPMLCGSVTQSVRVNHIPSCALVPINRQCGQVPGKQETSYAMSSDLGWVSSWMLVDGLKRRTSFVISAHSYDNVIFEFVAVKA